MKYLKRFESFSGKYAIKHIPSSKFIFDDYWFAKLEGRDDYGSTFLEDDEPVLVFNSREQAQECLTLLAVNNQIEFEDDNIYPLNEFEVVEV